MEFCHLELELSRGGEDPGFEEGGAHLELELSRGGEDPGFEEGGAQ